MSPNEVVESVDKKRTDRFKLVDALFDAALDQPVEERAQWLKQACDRDVALTAEIEKLLALAEEDDEQLQPGGEMIHEVWADVAADLERHAIPQTFRTGERVGGYNLNLLGSGGMGQVYAAEDTKLGRQVALKVLPPRLNSPEYRKRFEREAKAIAALNHPNIVHLYSVEHQNDVHFLTVELVKGKTLCELVQEKGLSLSQFLEVAANVTDGLASAHERGVIHRDLKPANVMVTKEGHAKILDFGVAKLKPGEFFQASNAPADSETAEGLILGTIAYMSPEQAEGKELDHRTDLFSLGVILFEMATRIRPFQGAAIFAEILTKQPPNVSDINPQMPREVGRIVKRCLSKDRKRRYQTAFDIKNDLDELRLEVDSRSLFRPMRPDTHGRRMGIVATVVVAVVAAVVFGVYLHPGAPDRPGPVTGTFDQLTSREGQEVFPSMSPDGRFVAYAGRSESSWDIHLLRIGGRRPINPNRKIFEARKRETASLGAGEKLVLGHPLAATIGDSARCMQNLEKVLFTGPKTSDTVTFICD